MSDYDTDLLTWSERQAALLRRRAAGELMNDAEIDWANVAVSRRCALERVMERSRRFGSRHRSAARSAG
jgi:hypothetical protein